ncbi:hypothetical protein M0R45_027248 [Rubus argutus]|uniref:Uncharacterized protein n=1 Tax=Rubus argutus TaxID=59490 RepID=A0AAW1X1N1_RUBAR
MELTRRGMISDVNPSYAVANANKFPLFSVWQIHCDPQVAAPRSSTRCTAVTAVSWSGSPTDQPTLHRHRYLSAKEIVLAIHPAPSVAAVEFTPSGKLKQCHVWELCFIYLMVASFTSEKAVA